MATAPDEGGFEQDRIRVLQDGIERIQKLAFTKWMNSILKKDGLHVDDLFTDLSDGRLLIRLLEIISGEKIGSVGRGRLRINKIENVGKAIHFLQQKKVNLKNIGAEDIVDGNPRLILGLVWTIILWFQMQGIQLEDESMEMKSAKEALLLWCQRKTAGYHGVNIKNFRTSWRSGLAFNALIHKHRPDLVDYGSLRPGAHIANLNNAFDVTEKQLGLPRLLTAEDVDVSHPDEKSIMVYLVSYCHYFSKVETIETEENSLESLNKDLLGGDNPDYSVEEETAERETSEETPDVNEASEEEVESIAMHPHTMVEVEEELQLREVEREVVTEVMVPHHVRTYYHYQGHGREFKRGETSVNMEWDFKIGDSVCVQSGFEIGQLFYLLLQQLFSKNRWRTCGHQDSHEYDNRVKVVTYKRVQKITTKKEKMEVLVKRKKIMKRKKRSKQ